MNSSNFRFTLDLHSIQSQYSIPVMVGDTSVTLHISITDGGVPYVINDGCLAKLSIKRPTGTHLEEFCKIRNNAIIEYPFRQNENTCAVEGIHHCDITLYGPNGEKVGGPRFTMVVAERVIRSDDIVVTDEDRTVIDAMVNEEAQRQLAEQERVATLGTLKEKVSKMEDMVDRAEALGIGVLEGGESENSLQQVDNRAIGVSTVALGADSIAGSKCYYISGIDPVNKQIYLNTKQQQLAAYGSPTEILSDNGVTPYKVNNATIPEDIRNEIIGKYIFIRNARHYEFIAKVVSCTEDGILTYEGALGFDKFELLSETPAPDEWTIRISEVPEFGEVILAKNEGCDTAIASGASCYASGMDSFAVNINNVSGGAYSFTAGRDNMAGYGAFATGAENKSTGYYSFTEGIGNVAGYNPEHTEEQIISNMKAEPGVYYSYNHAEGQGTRAVRRAAHSQGYKTIASGLASFAGGHTCEASGNYSTSLGYNTKSSGLAALSLGVNTEAIGEHTIAGGDKTKAKGTNAVVFGNGCSAEGYNALVSGINVNVNGHHAFGVGRNNTISANANYGAVLGYNNTIDGSLSFAAGEGNTVNAKRSFAIGYNNQILNETSDGKSHGTCFVAGQNNIADGGYSMTFGGSCENYGLYSITNGLKCTDYGAHSIVNGRENQIRANSPYSFNTGYGNITNGHQATIVAGRGLTSGANYQAVFGKFNEVDANALMVVGKGTDDGNRGNAFTVGSDYITVGGVALSAKQLQKILDNVLRLISFSVDGHTYQAEEGMTWLEWVDSEYGKDSIVSVSAGGTVYGKHSYLNVDSTDVIIANKAYSSVATGGEYSLR